MPKPKKLLGTLKVPGDKSISHRGLIFAVLCNGQSRIKGLSPAFDCASTISCLKEMGVHIETANDEVLISSSGISSLAQPKKTLFAGNSGTTIRLLSGLVSGQAFAACFDGDDSLRKRPMQRVLHPLQKMGAKVSYLERNEYPPFSIAGSQLQGISYICPAASAQVQTAVLLAGLQAKGQTSVQVPGLIRDHTLRLFKHIGIAYELASPQTVVVKKMEANLPGYDLEVPGDISSAAFFMVAAACLPGSKIKLVNLGINPGRTLIIDVLKSMGADITLENIRESAYEPVADVIVAYNGRLNGGTISGAEIAAGIDEIPALSVAGALCNGKFSVTGAAELKVKESNRLQSIVSNLQAAGANIKERDDGFEITGSKYLSGGSKWCSYADHRLAMTGIVAGILSENGVDVDDTECVSVSYPTFIADLQKLKVS